DVTALTATATVTFAPGDAGATLEIGDLTIDSADVAFAAGTKPMTIDLALPASDQPIPVTFAYHFKNHESFDGVSANGFSFLWPYHCGNVFPCHSEPDD